MTLENRNAKFTTIRAYMQRWLGLAKPVEVSNTATVETASVSEVNDETHISNASNIPPAPYDPELLERSRMQWQFGDWNSLTKIDIDTLEHHPQRAKLALVVACAWQQLNDHTIARRFIKLAKEWGCDKKIMAQLLIAGVYNTLGRSAAIEGNDTRAQTYFRLAVKGGGGDERLASHARSTNEIGQLQQLQLNKQNQNQVTDGLLSPKAPADSQDSASTYENNTPPDVNDNPFRPGIVSYAQNFEDVMLWRALGHIEKGFYIDIGAQDPVVDSVSKAFYEHGWRGVHVEATPAYAEALRKNRPDELVIEAAVSDRIGEMTFYEIPETGLSTGDADIALRHMEKNFEVKEITVACTTLAEIFTLAGDQEIHWLKIDVEGMEKHVLEGWGETEARPWIIVVESTLPNTQIETHEQWENLLLERGYRYAYFDGLSRFYVSEHHVELVKSFQYGPNIFDNFILSGSGGSYCSLLNTKLKQKDHELTKLEQNFLEQ